MHIRRLKHKQCAEEAAEMDTIERISMFASCRQSWVGGNLLVRTLVLRIGFITD